LAARAGRKDVGRPRDPSRRSGIPGGSAWRHQGDDQPRADATTARRPHYRRAWPRRHRSPRAPQPPRTRLTCGISSAVAMSPSMEKTSADLVLAEYKATENPTLVSPGTASGSDRLIR